MRSLNHQEKVKYAVLNAPYLIPLYFKKPYNPIITKSILKKLVPRSFGIEIECFGSFAEVFKLEMNTFYNSRRTLECIKEFYNITTYEEDNVYFSNYNQLFGEGHDRNFNEHKIRCKNYTQLKGLYEILEMIKLHCRINEGSGIHIHINLNDIWNETYPEKTHKIFNTLLYPKMDEIEKIFYPNEKYIPEYNHNKEIGLCKGHNWVAFRPGFQTIEFRIAPMTFEYSIIINWIIKCTKLVNWAISKNAYLKKRAKYGNFKK